MSRRRGNGEGSITRRKDGRWMARYTVHTTNGPKQAVLYARVSTEEQARSGYSLAQQLEALREYAAREGYEVLKEVMDPSQSGASLERPGMGRVRDLVAAGGVSAVLAQLETASPVNRRTYTCSSKSSPLAVVNPLVSKVCQNP